MDNKQKIDNEIQSLRSSIMRGELTETEERIAREKIKALKLQYQDTLNYRHFRQQERIYSWINI